ncbi:DUF2110 family protein [Salinarchaeum laminariae]|uniref:DUF2110 family protein n=1 Tax=Salinarchaeum laminariae TaxID=869888 RepID=UPI0020BF2A40|nr:DUF2110 family protein [Salinarchaeum laminariae]
MAAVVLARKCYVAGDARERTLRSLRGLLGDRLSDLDVDVEIELREDDFPVVTLDGEDEVVARNLLAEEFGEIPVATDGDGGPGTFEPGETYVGTLESWDEGGFVLDAGQPVRIPPDGIDLGPGNPEQIVERFGLVQHLAMEFVVPESDADADDRDGQIVADLADSERDRLYDWQRGSGRVTVNSATRSEVRATVNRAGHAQDIVTVERLGMLEQSIVCKDGTDPPGLIASIGEYLPAQLRAVV